MESEKKGIIYGMCDPRNGELRYVGQTSLTLAKRLIAHCVPSHLKRDKSPSTNWIRKLRKLGLKPEAFVIEKVPVSELDKAEIQWISYFRYIGARLLNLSPGGGLMSEEQRKTLIEFNKQLWAERRDELSEKISIALKEGGYGLSERNLAQLARMSATHEGSTISEEHKAAISKHNKDKIVSDVTRQRLSIAKTGVCTEAQRKHLDEWNEQQRGKPHTGTHKINHRQAISKLNIEQVTEIRALISEGQLTIQKIADKYKVSHSTIRAIRDGITWKD